MSGYIRQSQAEILDGEPVVAGPLNREFNAIADTFDGSLGHTHDGSTGQGTPINLETSVSGILPQGNGGGAKNNYNAEVDPLASDDENADYSVGSRWVNTVTGDLFELQDATASTAVWVKTATYNYVDGLITTNEDILEDTEAARDAAITAKDEAQAAQSAATNAKNDAVTAKNSAESAATTATTKASEASTSATNASNSATAAATSATNSSNSATASSTSATLAQRWANEDEDVIVASGEYSAYHWAAKAEASAIEAATFDPDSYYTKLEADAKYISALVDPNDDRILFWDDSAGVYAYLSLATGLSISGTTLSVATASTTVSGIVELATNTETQTGSDAARAVTPAGLTSRTATETRTGLIELATQAEVDAGTDSERAVTSSTLAGVAAKRLIHTSISADTSATASKRYIVDTSSADVTLTMPSTFNDGDTIEVVRLGDNSVIVARNGHDIAGLAEDLTIDMDKTITNITKYGSNIRVTARIYA